MPPTSPVQRQSAIARQVEDHENRIEDLELRLDKYDAIIVRLDTLIDVLTRRVEDTAHRADEAIDGQGIIAERNANTNRWNAIGVSLACSFIVGITMFLVGYILHP